VHEGAFTIRGNPARQLTFRRPDGRLVHQRPAALTGDAATLTQLDHRQHINHGPTIITSARSGDTVDLDWAIAVLIDDH
jgi:hypothetical protein